MPVSLVFKSITHVVGKGPVALVSLSQNRVTLAHFYTGRTVEADGQRWVVKGVEFAQLNGRPFDQIGLVLMPA